MPVLVAMAREQARLVIQGAESALGRSCLAAGRRLPVGLPSGLATVGAGSGRIGLLPRQPLLLAAF
jgi:hypothetical protein